MLLLGFVYSPCLLKLKAKSVDYKFIIIYLVASMTKQTCAVKTTTVELVLTVQS